MNKDGFSSLAGSAVADNYCLACHGNNLPYRLTCARCGSLTEHGAESAGSDNPHYDHAPAFAGLPEHLQPRGETPR